MRRQTVDVGVYSAVIRTSFLSGRLRLTRGTTSGVGHAGVRSSDTCHLSWQPLCAARKDLLDRVQQGHAHSVLHLGLIFYRFLLLKTPGRVVVVSY